VPYPALLIPYDLAVLAGLFLAAQIIGAGRAVRTRALSLAASVVAGGSIWYDLARHVGGSLLILGVVLQLGAVALAARHALARRTAPFTLAWFALATGAANAIAAGTAPPAPDLLRTGVAALLYPVTLVLLVSRGLPGLAPRPTRSERWLAAAALALVVGCALSLPLALPRMTTDSDTDGGAAGGDRSVILVVLDTARADHFASYGYHRNTTPHLDRWAESARLFDDVTATSSWTLPSHASIFTGRPARSHGAHGFRGTGRAVANAQALAAEQTTIAELAREVGIRTGAVVANHLYLAPSFGLGQGFDQYHVPAPHAGQRFPPADWLAHRLQPGAVSEYRWTYARAPWITDLAIRWLELAGERPFLLFVNYMDVHRPNLRPPTAEIPLDDEIAPDALDLNLLEIHPPSSIPAPAVHYLVNNYDRELMVLDRELGRLLQHVERSGLGQRTTVFVTSDHGEYLGEHGLFGHSRHLHEEVLRVPLIVRGPGIVPGRDPRPVESADLFAAIGDRLGLGSTGSILSMTEPVASEPRTIVSEWYLPANDHLLAELTDGAFARDLLALRRGRYKLFQHDHGRVELYDLFADRGELVDLAADRPDLVRTLAAELERWREAHPKAISTPATSLPVTDETREQIRALGYVTDGAD